MAAAILSVAASVLGGLFGKKPDPRIQADIIPAYQRGDVAYLQAWINDQPPHPADSVAAARQALAQLTHSPVYGVPASSGYGGRIAQQPNLPPDAAGVAFTGPQTPSGQAYVPYYYR